MKIVVLFLLMFLAGCNNRKGWTAQDQQQFLGGCVSKARKDMSADKATAYCSCMLEKIRKRYPNAAEARYINTDTAVYRFGRECLPR